MWLRIIAVGVLVLGFAAIGSSGSSLGVGSTDSVAVGELRLTAGDSALTAVDRDGPAIDFAVGGASGINPGLVVVIGDPDAPARDHAFALHNDAASAAPVTLRYDYDRAPPADAGVDLAVYDAAGTRLASTADATPARFDLGAGTSAYLVVTVDATGATPADDLSGSLSITTRQ